MQTKDDADLEEDQRTEESEKSWHVIKQPSCKRSILFLGLTYARPRIRKRLIKGLKSGRSKKVEIRETYTWDKPSGTATEIDNVHCWIFGDNRN